MSMHRARGRLPGTKQHHPLQLALPVVVLLSPAYKAYIVLSSNLPPSAYFPLRPDVPARTLSVAAVAQIA